jgi:tetratricopeptide (TPR) repeat protein
MEVVYNLALLNEVQGRSDEAERLLKKLLDETAKPAGGEYTVREKANRAVFVERLGYLYRNQERFTEAEQYFRQLADLDSENSGRAVANVIDTLRQARQYQRAREEADAAVKKYPKDTTLKLTRASLLGDLGNVDEAVSALKAMLAGSEKSETGADNQREVWGALAQIYERAHRFPEALEAAAKIESLASTKEQKETAYFLRGSILERAKKNDEAETWFRKALELNPDSPGTLNYLGYMWADKGMHLEEAVKMITRALEMDPQNGAYMDSLGWAYFRLNKMDLAEQYLLKATQRVSRDATIRDHLADVYYKTGRVREALREWQAAVNEFAKALPGENEPDDVAKVQKKLEDAKVRLAKEQGQAK